MESNVTEYTPYSSAGLMSFYMWYTSTHGYLSILVCAFGIPMNLINITVLSQKHMRTPINCILTWLAVSDLLTMTSYVPFALHFYCLYPPLTLSPERNSEGWMKFILFHINFSAATHTVSIWLGVTLAILRYKHIYSPASGAITRIRRLVRARIAVVMIYVLSTIGMTPNYMTYKLVAGKNEHNETVYVIEDIGLGTPNVKPVVLLNLWMYSILAKLLPCILMVVYGGLLVWTLRSTLRHKRRRLSCSSSVVQRPLDNSRTTRMLLVVIVLFLITEFPQGILTIMSVTSKGFFSNIYAPLGDLMDIVALINNGVNFVLYCAMSRDFRTTLMDLLKKAFMPNAKYVASTGAADPERSNTALLMRMT